MPNITIYLGTKLYPEYISLSEEEQNKLKEGFKLAIAKRFKNKKVI